MGCFLAKRRFSGAQLIQITGQIDHSAVERIGDLGEPREADPVETALNFLNLLERLGRLHWQAPSVTFSGLYASGECERQAQHRTCAVFARGAGRLACERSVRAFASPVALKPRRSRSAF
jgi:hypothetical protein